MSRKRGRDWAMIPAVFWPLEEAFVPIGGWAEGMVEWAGEIRIVVVSRRGMRCCAILCYGRDEFDCNPIDELIDDAFAWEREN